MKDKKKKNKNYEMLISFEDLPKELRWQACLEKLSNEYTITIKDMCKILMCSRSWATRYLKPHLHYIYISNGAGLGPNYVNVARELLQKEMTASTWYSPYEFYRLIENHIDSITRQTIRIPVEMLIASEKKSYFAERLNSILEMQKECTKLEELAETKKMHDELILKCATEEGKFIWKNRPSQYERSKSTAVEYELAEFDIHSLNAVHDIKEYGDSDEEIYRQLFEAGYIKIIIKIPDKDGCVSKKIYYIAPNDEFAEGSTDEMVLISYEDYIEYKGYICAT